jgi:hypothetical protein
MTASLARQNPLWCLIAVEAAGSQTILWNGIPITGGCSPGRKAPTPVIVVPHHWSSSSQIAHWAAFRLRRNCELRRNVLLGCWCSSVS